jgi:catechol 2,3-dioxygenase-like lactoylglutathione lyase family enzyme
MSQDRANISFISAVPQFAVPDLVETVEYYRDRLGFQIGGYWDGERVSPSEILLRFLRSCGVTRVSLEFSL